MTSPLADQLRELAGLDPSVPLDDYALAAGAAAASLALRIDDDRAAAMSAAQEPFESGLIARYVDALLGTATAAIWDLARDDPDRLAALAEHLRHVAAGWHENRDHSK